MARAAGVVTEVTPERVVVHSGRLDRDFEYPLVVPEGELATREEIGDESYDAMLYATGRKNRVVIRELLENSPGRSFGFESGDVVLSYDDRLIFRGRELRRATTQGERGEWVTVDVLRNGEVVRLRAQRGPIGAQLQSARILPDALW